MMELAYDIAECFGMEPDARIVYDNRRTLYASEPIPIVGPEVSGARSPSTEGVWSTRTTERNTSY